MLTVDSPVGPLTIVVERGALTRLGFGALSGGLSSDEESDVAAQLREYFAGVRRVFDLSLRPSGTEFSEPSGIDCCRSRSAKRTAIATWP